MSVVIDCQAYHDILANVTLSKISWYLTSCFYTHCIIFGATIMIAILNILSDNCDIFTSSLNDLVDHELWSCFKNLVMTKSIEKLNFEYVDRLIFIRILQYLLMQNCKLLNEINQCHAILLVYRWTIVLKTNVQCLLLNCIYKNKKDNWH